MYCDSLMRFQFSYNKICSTVVKEDSSLQNACSTVVKEDSSVQNAKLLSPSGCLRAWYPPLKRFLQAAFANIN